MKFFITSNTRLFCVIRWRNETINVKVLSSLADHSHYESIPHTVHLAIASQLHLSLLSSHQSTVLFKFMVTSGHSALDSAAVAEHINALEFFFVRNMVCSMLFKMFKSFYETGFIPVFWLRNYRVHHYHLVFVFLFHTVRKTNRILS